MTVLYLVSFTVQRISHWALRSKDSPRISPLCSFSQLPMIYCIENNQYGMGTSKERSSSNSTYYTMGNHIPGFKLDGMNVLMIREVGKPTAHP